MRKGNEIITFQKKPLKKQIVLDEKGNYVILYNRPYTIDEFFNSSKYIATNISKTYSNIMTDTNRTTDTSFVKQITYHDVYFYIVELFVINLSGFLNILNKYFEYLSKLVQIKILNDHEKFLIFTELVKSFYTYNYPDYDYYKKTADNKYLKDLYKLRYLLKFNSIKFEKPFIIKLVGLVESLYNKKVEFNIVNLNKVHLNSDILTQAIILKLRNKKNKFYRIFKSSLNRVKILPGVGKLYRKIDVSNKKNYFINDVRNKYINDMFNNGIVKKDSLNELLSNHFPSANKLEIEDLFGVKKNISLKDYIFRYLKHFRLAGVRLEAKGRISKRYTASRSVFKLN
jgi:hypothetical protein